MIGGCFLPSMQVPGLVMGHYLDANSCISSQVRAAWQHDEDGSAYLHTVGCWVATVACRQARSPEEPRKGQYSSVTHYRLVSPCDMLHRSGCVISSGSAIRLTPRLQVTVFLQSGSRQSAQTPARARNRSMHASMYDLDDDDRCCIEASTSQHTVSDLGCYLSASLTSPQTPPASTSLPGNTRVDCAHTRAGQMAHATMPPRQAQQSQP